MEIILYMNLETPSGNICMTRHKLVLNEDEIRDMFNLYLTETGYIPANGTIDIAEIKND